MSRELSLIHVYLRPVTVSSTLSRLEDQGTILRLLIRALNELD